jgi:hypothetical protein
MYIDDGLAKFIVQLEADGRSTRTIGQYRRHVRLLAAWCRDVRPRVRCQHRPLLRAGIEPCRIRDR